MTTPRLGLAELLMNQSQPHVPVNAAMRRIDALLQATAIEFVTTLPGSPADGDSYIVAASGTSGALVGKENNFIYYYGGWQYIVPVNGMRVYVLDDATEYIYETGSPGGWTPFASGGGGGGTVESVVAGANISVDDTDPANPIVSATSGAAAVVNTASTNTDATAANAGNYTRFSYASPTYTFDDGEGFTIGAEYHGRYVGVGSLTITEAGGMTVNAPAGGTLVIPPQGTFTVKIVAADEADLLGVTVPV